LHVLERELDLQELSARNFAEPRHATPQAQHQG
jgi:hypothetical protein